MGSDQIKYMSQRIFRLLQESVTAKVGNKILFTLSIRFVVRSPEKCQLNRSISGVMSGDIASSAGACDDGRGNG